MKYSIRNSLILLSLLLVIIIVTIASSSQYKKKIELLEKKYKEKTLTYNNLEHVSTGDYRVEQLEIDLKRMQFINSNSKQFISDENPTTTFEYLSNITASYCPDVNFNFEVAKSDTTTQLLSNTYIISGKAELSSFYTFLSQIEHQFPLYAIDKLLITEENVTNTVAPTTSITNQTNMDQVIETLPMPGEEKTFLNPVNFSFDLLGYSDETGSKLTEIALRNLPYFRLPTNPFQTKVHTPNNTDQNNEATLPNIYQSTIISITRDRLFMKDNSGKLHVMVLGSRVASGYLASINWQNQSATFILNVIGIPVKKIMYLSKG